MDCILIYLSTDIARILKRSSNSTTCLLAVGLITKHWGEKAQRLKLPLPSCKTHNPFVLISLMSEVWKSETNSAILFHFKIMHGSCPHSFVSYSASWLPFVTCYTQILKHWKATSWQILFGEILKDHMKHSCIFLCQNQISPEQLLEILCITICWDRDEKSNICRAFTIVWGPWGFFDTAVPK